MFQFGAFAPRTIISEENEISRSRAILPKDKDDNAGTLYSVRSS